jgi:hypothetical protein
MIQNSEVLTREDNWISLVSARRATTQEGYLAIAEREIPVNAIEQTWIFEVGEEARADRTYPALVNALVKITKWLNHLGSGRIDDSYLGSRHNIRHNFKTNGIRF